jgi:hypothetical protein
MSILETLRDRQKQRQQADHQRLTSAVVISGNFGRYSVNDGFESLECETTIAQQLKPGDRVWLARGHGVNVIVGVSGTDLTKVTNP